jgi:5'-AMP-activated protein kinase regulatory gamma subunit
MAENETIVEAGATIAHAFPTAGNLIDQKTTNRALVESPPTELQTKEQPQTSPDPRVPDEEQGEHSDWHADLKKLRVLVRKLISKYTCYDLIPESGKIVIFDERLPIKHAFFALVQNDIKCAPVWSPRSRMFLGLMTVTDFADILVGSYDDQSFKEKCLNLENQTVASWAMYKKKRGHAPKNSLICVKPTDHIEEAVETLFKLFIHRLPVLNDKDGTSIMCIINHQKIIRFLMEKLLPQQTLLNSLPLEAFSSRIIKVDSFCQKTDPLVEVLRLLTDHSRNPGIPILDNKGEVWDCFDRSDIRYLAVDRTYLQLNITVEEFITTHHKSRNIPRVDLNDPLIRVLTALIANRRHMALVFSKQSFYGIFTLAQLFADWIAPEPDTALEVLRDGTGEVLKHRVIYKNSDSKIDYHTQQDSTFFDEEVQPNPVSRGAVGGRMLSL